MPTITALCITISNRIIYVKSIAIVGTLITFAFSICIYAFFDVNLTYQFIENYKWWPLIGLEYYVGIDGISLCLILLTNFLTLICILITVNSITFYPRECLICILLIESFAIGAFAALNLALFYIFFEALLVPLYLIIGIWGGKNRIYAAIKFFLYTLIGSLLFLVSIIYIYLSIKTLNLLDIQDLINQHINPYTQNILWILIFIALSIKVPIFPLHSWLADAHTEASTIGSILLTGIILKIGTYGFLRILLPIFPLSSIKFSNIIIILSIIGIIYSSLITLYQDNIKKIIAYSSIAHMGYVTCGIFSFSDVGIVGAAFQMFSHSLISSGLFLIIGILYSRTNTFNFSDYGGVAIKAPKLARIFMILVLASIGLPGTSGFIGEFFTLLGMMHISVFYTVEASLGIIFSTIYMLRLYHKIMLGSITNKEINQFTDIDGIELITLIAIVIPIIFLGIFPEIIKPFFINILHLNLEASD